MCVGYGLKYSMMTDRICTTLRVRITRIELWAKTCIAPVQNSVSSIPHVKRAELYDAKRNRKNMPQETIKAADTVHPQEASEMLKGRI